VNDEEKCVTLPRTNDVQFHGGFSRGGHCLPDASAYRSIRQFQALFTAEQIPRFRAGVFVCHHIGFRTEVCLRDNDLIA